MKETECPASELLKSISGKLKPQILKMAAESAVRFNALLRDLEGANKQTLTTALKELESDGVLIRETIQLKPLHVEYTLSEKGQKLIQLLKQLEGI